MRAARDADVDDDGDAYVTDGDRYDADDDGDGRDEYLFSYCFLIIFFFVSSSLGLPLRLALFVPANRPVQVFPVANLSPRLFSVAATALILHEICWQAFPWPRHSFAAFFLVFCLCFSCFPSLPFPCSLRLLC